MTETTRRALRREIHHTIGILADPTAFATMRDTHPGFPFTDHHDYLHETEALLRTLRARGARVGLALFDPHEYAHHCLDRALDPDTRRARVHYTAELAATAIPYEGQPLAELLPHLARHAEHRAHGRHAELLLAEHGDFGATAGALARADHIAEHLLDAAGPGRHHLVCSVAGPDGVLSAALHARHPDPDHADHPGHGPTGDGPLPWDPHERAAFTTVLAVGVLTGGPGGLVLRTARTGRPDRVHGWRLTEGGLVPLSAGAVFDAYCTDPATGDPIGPEPGVDHCAGYPIPEPDRDLP
ncbi:hypothetical protein ACN20G_23965 [Streptomyces sp. BI20]|uniref:hypothetical protein n=1 Tax=Streptomyces sp. BI20 TaxID=3403460 RepID=UPI003C76D2E0